MAEPTQSFEVHRMVQFDKFVCLQGGFVKCHEIGQKLARNDLKWLKMTFLTQKSLQMTFFDLKSELWTQNGLFDPKTGFFLHENVFCPPKSDTKTQNHPARKYFRVLLFGLTFIRKFDHRNNQ